jgi:hypothetical protein
VGRILEIQLVRWGWLSGTVSLLIGGYVLAPFLTPFNYLTPSGMSGSATALAGNAGVIGGGDSGSASLLEVFIDETGRRTPFLFEASRQEGANAA